MTNNFMLNSKLYFHINKNQADMTLTKSQYVILQVFKDLKKMNLTQAISVISLIFLKTTHLEYNLGSYTSEIENDIVNLCAKRFLNIDRGMFKRSDLITLNETPYVKENLVLNDFSKYSQYLSLSSMQLSNILFLNYHEKLNRIEKKKKLLSYSGRSRK